MHLEARRAPQVFDREGEAEWKQLGQAHEVGERQLFGPVRGERGRQQPRLDRLITRAETLDQMPLANLL